MLKWLTSKSESVYRVGARYPDPNDFPSYKITNIPQDELIDSWMELSSGSPLSRELPDKLVYEVDKNLPSTDLMRCAGGGGILVTARFAELISGMSTCVRI